MFTTAAEQFENDGSPISNLIKSVKRTMPEIQPRTFGEGFCRAVPIDEWDTGRVAGWIRFAAAIGSHGRNSQGTTFSLPAEKHPNDRVILVPRPSR